MARLIYAMNTSLDGYISDRDGKFDWSTPTPELFAAINELERPIGTYLYGRRLYEVMRAWETAQGPGFEAPLMRDYAALWQAAQKVVYSSTLDAVTTSRTRLERSFEPDAVRRLKAAADSDISIGGPGLAAGALAAGLVDECHLFISPVVVGGGTAWLPGGLRLRLELLDERRFGNGVVHLHYRTSSEPV